MTETRNYSEAEERAVLGCCLAQPEDVLEETLGMLSKSDFYVPAHRIFWECLESLHAKGKAIDVVTTHQWLVTAQKQAEISTPSFQGEILAAYSSHLAIGTYRRTVKDFALIRHLKRACTEIVRDAEENPADVALLMDRAESRILTISQPQHAEEILDSKAAAKDFRAFLEDVEAQRHAPMLATGIKNLDELNGGFPIPGYVVIAAPPGGGKSALMMTLNENWCSQGIGVGNFSLEMTTRKLMQRRVGNRAKVDTRVMNSPMQPAMKTRVHAALDDIEDTPFWIDPTNNLGPSDLRARTRKMVKMGAKVIILDYVQLLRGSSGADSTKRQLAEVSRTIANIQKEMGILFICLAQITREAQKRGGFQQFDLADAAELTNDARMILMLEHAPEKNNVPYPLDRIPLVGRLSKVSDGSTGDVNLTFDKLTQKIW